ncbi:hypothetical protein KFK09_008106 [Dendrobium nobile]|uniref:Uncharacterized protein n=1 Tax=Dendrobium nobile TaxID=94219 RepID=A0A8T3BTK9_DENNO|nr:hypothetical protein KFK09_008106 [Dendrobium nobile]
MNPKSTSFLGLGGSLPVPNVQELARSGEIPERYLRPEEDHHAGHVITVDDLELPLIDLMKLVNPEFFHKEELSRLGWACREWEFFKYMHLHAQLFAHFKSISILYFSYFVLFIIFLFCPSSKSWNSRRTDRENKG